MRQLGLPARPRGGLSSLYVLVLLLCSIAVLVLISTVVLLMLHYKKKPLQLYREFLHWGVGQCGAGYTRAVQPGAIIRYRALSYMLYMQKYMLYMQKYMYFDLNSVNPYSKYTIWKEVVEYINIGPALYVRLCQILAYCQFCK